MLLNYHTLLWNNCFIKLYYPVKYPRPLTNRIEKKYLQGYRLLIFFIESKINKQLIDYAAQLLQQ